MEQIIDLIKKKADLLIERIDPSNHMHESGITLNGKYSDKERYFTFYSPKHWTHSFLFGIMAHLYSITKDKKYLEFINKAKPVYWEYLSGKRNMVAHDAGFLYSLYAVATYNLTGDTEMRDMALKAADEIGKRYQFNPKVMDAFGDVYEENHEDAIILMIVDDMMNMPLLMWAYEETKHSFYKQVFINHINTAIKYLIRDDYSVRHAYHFDNKTGNPLCEMNYCGYSAGSHWARGTAWMIYGLTKALQYTGNEKIYLPTLIGVVEKYLHELNGDIIPNWDFRAPTDEYIRKDTSAAAIVGCAFYWMKKMNSENKFIKKYSDIGKEMFNALVEYMDCSNNENILFSDVKREFGSLWGDYFFTELTMLANDTCVDFWI